MKLKRFSSLQKIIYDGAFLLLLLVLGGGLFPKALNAVEPSGSIGVILEYVPAKKLTRIRAVFQNSPAAKAKIQPGDEIVSINGIAANTLSFAEIGNKVRGPAGSSITLVLKIPAFAENREVTLKRVPAADLSPLVYDGSGKTTLAPQTQNSSITPSLPKPALNDAEKAQIRSIILKLKTVPEKKKMEKLLGDFHVGKLSKEDLFKALKKEFRTP